MEQIVVADVRKQLRERYTEEQINAIIDMYAAAYGASTEGMTDAQISKLRMEILEEIICDSLGEMNVFAGAQSYKNYVGTVGVFLRDANKAAQNRGAATAEKSTAENGGVVKYSIAEIIDENGKSYGDGVILDSDKLTGLSDEARVAKVVGIIRSFGGKPFIAIDSNGNEQEIIVVPNKKYKNKKGKDVYANRHLTKFLNDTVKQEALVLVDQMISTATYESSEPAQHPHGWLDNNGKNDWENWKVFLQEKDGTVWEAYMRVTNSTEGEKILYEVYPIKKWKGPRNAAPQPLRIR